MQTDIRLETIELPTYEVGPENPNPWFATRLGAHPYPYRLQNRLTGRRAVRSHEAVILENELLRLTFLPDFGCRLFSAYDKLLAREVFYRNDCIRPSLIAIRGAWISGGIEFNFPIGHAVYTHSRIPFTTRRDDDGSASMIFGLTEQMTGMRFTVEVRLAPGEYRFSERVRLYNGTPLPHKHYWWTNAAVRCTQETQLIYPMVWGISGAYGDHANWPIHDGNDLSWARNHLSAGDVFAGETYDEFFGVYHWDLGFGVAHWAKQDELPGRKMFFWGQDEMGKLWQSMLTENAGEYLEIQAGRFATQSDFDLLDPHELVEFTEYWIPIGKMDGFVKAHKAGAINVLDGGVAIQLTTSAKGRVMLSDGPRILGHFDHTFEPGEVYRFDAPACENLTVRVFDEKGLVLLYDAGVRERRCDTVPRGRQTPPTIVPEFEDDPLSRTAFWEGVLSGPLRTPDSELRIECFQEDMDAAAHYFETGMADKAGAIIRSWSEAIPPEDPFFDALARELGCEIPEHRRPDEFGIVNCFAHRDLLIRLLRGRDDPVGRVHLGNALCALDRTDEAIECWKKAIQSGIEDYLPYRNLALAYWHTKDEPEAAYDLMKQAADIRPEDSDCLRDMDILAEMTEAYAERPAIAERILRFAPDDSACIERAVRILLESDRLDEAVELLTTKQFFVAELAYQTRILYVRVLLTRGSRFFAEGQFDQAADDFRSATEYPANLGASRFHDSSDAQAFYLLGLALEKSGRTAHAREAWESAANDIPVPASEQAFYVARARMKLGRADAEDAIGAIRPPEEPGEGAWAEARTQYLLGLRSLAEGDSQSAGEHLQAARAAEKADAVKMHNYLEGIAYSRSSGRRVPIPVWWTVEP